MQFSSSLVRANFPLIQIIEELFDVVLLTTGGNDVGWKIALAVMHLPNIVIHSLNDMIDQGLFKLDIPESSDNLFLELDDFLLDAGNLTIQGITIVELLVDLFLLLIDLLDLIQKSDYTWTLIHLIFSGIIFFNGLHNFL